MARRSCKEPYDLERPVGDGPGAALAGAQCIVALDLSDAKLEAARRVAHEIDIIGQVVGEPHLPTLPAERYQRSVVSRCGAKDTGSYRYRYRYCLLCSLGFTLSKRVVVGS